MSEETKRYPGDLATPAQIRLLADEYRRAAHTLLELGRRGDPLTRAPFRLSALHAIELYLNALLLHSGKSPSQLRGMQHDFAARGAMVAAAGLRLRTRTADHLKTLSFGREYLVTRYGPELLATSTQVNRLTATLEEVAKKVAATLPSAERAS